MTTRVLLIDGEAQLARVLRVNLKTQGYQADTAHLGQTALAAAARRPPDLVVLDLDLPDMTGVEVIRSLRNWTRVPIIVLSGRTRSRDKVEALDAGADDYVTKPFKVDELMARLRAASRRAGAITDVARVCVGGHSVDLARHRVNGPEGEVELTPVEWEVLHVLVRKAGRLVTQPELLAEVGGRAYLRESSSLRVHLANLRQKLESDPARPVHIVTEPGMGYRFNP